VNKETDRAACDECHSCFPLSDALRAPSPFDPSDELLACPICKSVNSLSLVCDEPGCERLRSCGFPTATGYRSTCWEHSPMKAHK
jgi:hypothetical protein